jgi:hypothetical protein
VYARRVDNDRSEAAPRVRGIDGLRVRTASIDDLGARDLVGDVTVSVDSGPSLDTASAAGWDDALARLAPLLQQPLLDEQRRDWWAPLRIDLATLALAFCRAEAWRDSLIDQSVDRVVLATRLPSFWRAALAPLPVTFDRRRTAARMVSSMLGPQAGETLKLMGLDGGIRRVATPLAALFGRRGQQPGREWMLVGEIPTPSMLDSLLLLPAESSTVVACDPRVAAIAARRGHLVSALWPALSGLRNDFGHDLVDQACRQISGAQLGGLEAPVQRLVRRSLPGLVRAQDAFRRKISDLQVEHVVLASDQHKYGVLAVWAAEDAALPSTVIQHGLPAHPIAYLPVRATTVACIGLSSSRWFEKRGTPPARLTVTGSPRMPAMQDFRVPSGPVSRLLVAVNPGNHPFQHRMLHACTQLASGMPRLTITIRPHPGDRRFDGCPEPEALSLLGIPASSSQFRVDGTAPLSEQLTSHDVLMVHDSTVGVEALLAGTPILVFAPEQGFYEGLGLPSAENAEDLHASMVDTGAWSPQNLGRARDRLVAAGGSDALARVVRALRESSP